MSARSFVSILFVIGAGMLPFACSAATVSSGGGVIVETHASASSGGQTATGRQNIKTDNTSASVTTHTVIQSDAQGSKAQVHVTTEKNGVPSTQSIEKTASKGETLTIHVATTSGAATAAQTKAAVATATAASAELSATATGSFGGVRFATSGTSTIASSTPDWFVGLVTNVINWFIGLWHVH